MSTHSEQEERLMTRHRHDPPPGYVDLVDHIREFADEQGGNNAIRAVADGLEDLLREQFKASYGVDKTTDGGRCIGRLISDGGRCTHNTPSKWSSSGDPPHSPPHADHADLWLADGEPAAYTMHLYDFEGDQMRDVVEFADEWGLSVRSEPWSWYFPNQTVHVVFFNPGGVEKD